MRPIPLSHHDYCSGLGGFAIAARRHGFITTRFCELKPEARRYLHHHFPNVPIYDNIKTTTLDHLCLGTPTVLTAGFPCQPYSITGTRDTYNDDRYLWPHVLRVITTSRPPWVVLENVDDLCDLGLDLVLVDLAKAHYLASCFVLPACAVGTPHRRDRLYIVAHTTSHRVERPGEGFVSWESCEQTRSHFGRIENLVQRSLVFEPKLLRTTHDVPNFVERHDLIGEAVVPELVERIMELIAMWENNQ